MLGTWILSWWFMGPETLNVGYLDPLMDALDSHLATWQEVP